MRLGCGINLKYKQQRVIVSIKQRLQTPREWQDFTMSSLTFAELRREMTQKQQTSFWPLAMFNTVSSATPIHNFSSFFFIIRHTYDFTEKVLRHNYNQEIATLSIERTKAVSYVLPSQFNCLGGGEAIETFTSSYKRSPSVRTGEHGEWKLSVARCLLPTEWADCAYAGLRAFQDL